MPTGYHHHHHQVRLSSRFQQCQDQNQNQLQPAKQKQIGLASSRLHRRRKQSPEHSSICVGSASVSYAAAGHDGSIIHRLHRSTGVKCVWVLLAASGLALRVRELSDKTYIDAEKERERERVNCGRRQQQSPAASASARYVSRRRKKERGPILKQRREKKAQLSSKSNNRYGGRANGGVSGNVSRPRLALPLLPAEICRRFVIAALKFAFLGLLESSFLFPLWHWNYRGLAGHDWAAAYLLPFAGAMLFLPNLSLFSFTIKVATTHHSLTKKPNQNQNVFLPLQMAHLY